MRAGPTIEPRAPGPLDAPRRLVRLIAQLGIAAALALGSSGSSGCRADEPAVVPGPSATIRGQRVAIEVTRTREEMTRGLGYRDSLAWNRGMLFRYDEPGFYSFWMKGMRFDIDIVWIRDDRIVDISHRVPHAPSSNGPTVRPREASDSVLEVPAGYAAHARQLPHVRGVDLDHNGYLLLDVDRQRVRAEWYFEGDVRRPVPDEHFAGAFATARGSHRVERLPTQGSLGTL